MKHTNVATTLRKPDRFVMVFAALAIVEAAAWAVAFTR